MWRNIFLISCLARIVLSQNNSFTIAFWTEPRAAIVRDTLYIDGGYLNYYTIDPSNPGSYDSYFDSTNHAIFQLNLGRQFDTTLPTKADIFDLVPEPLDNGAPSYTQSGMMFANNDQMYLYGGLYPGTATDDYVLPANQVQNYRRYTADASTSVIPSGSAWYLETMTNGTINYVTNGAGINVPSQNMGYYFSGMHGPSWGPIWALAPQNSSYQASVPSNALISVDMTNEGRGVWTNTTIDPSITPRSNGQLVWLPYSTDGILLSIGGVQYSSDSTNGSVNEGNSSSFTSVIPVYDIANNKWYQQNTSGVGTDASSQSPGQLAGFCSVVASATDNSSHSIYVYGGYDGVSSSPNDNVWILSVPSFVWVKVYASTNVSHARSGHICVKPYPNQMMVVGGTQGGGPLNDGVIQVFNFNNNTFQSIYDPTQFSFNYSVPSAVVNAIGGSSTGGATITTPAASWGNSAIASLFAAKYSGSQPTYYPYKPYNGTVASSTPTQTPAPQPTNKWLGPVVGVIGALVLISLLAGIYFIFFRRRSSRRTSVTSTQTPGGRNRISRWLMGTPHPDAFPKSEASIATTEVDEVNGSAELSGNTPGFSYYSPNSPRRGNVPYNGESSQGRNVAEVAGDQGAERYEMHSMSPPVPASELPTAYHFQDHPAYPRSIDYAFNEHSESQSNQGGPSSYGGIPRSYLPHNPDVLIAGTSNGPSSFHDQTNNIANSAPVSPPMTQGHSPTTTSGSVGGGGSTTADKHLSAESGPSALTSRPSLAHRHMSSISSGITQPDSPNSPNTTLPDAEHARQEGEVSPDLDHQLQSRPPHKRNMSSMSSGLVLSPVETDKDGAVGREEEEERYWAGLPQKGDVKSVRDVDEGTPLVGSGSGLVKRKEVPGSAEGRY